VWLSFQEKRSNLGLNWYVLDTELRFLVLFLIRGHFTHCLMSEVSGEALVVFTVTLTHAMNSPTLFSCVRNSRVLSFNRKWGSKHTLFPLQLIACAV